MQSYTESIKLQIETLQHEKLELEEKINDFSAEKEISFYRNGQYNDNIRMVYEDLLCMGLSFRKGNVVW